MKIYKIALSLVFTGNLFFAQNQKLTMQEAIMGLYTNLRVENYWYPTWLKNSNSLSYYSNGQYHITDAKTGKTEKFLSLYEDLGKIFPSNFLPKINFIDTQSGYFNYDNQYYKILKKDNKWVVNEWLKVPEDAENTEIVWEKDLIIYTLKNNLYYTNSQGQKTITNEEDENIISGQSVHRQEFGINKGIFVSPDKTKIAFYKMNQTMVKDYPIINWSENPAQNHNIKYPMAGQASHQVVLAVYDLETGKTTFINTAGDKEQYLTAISWRPNSKNIFIGQLNRRQNHLQFNMYNAENGTFVKTIFEEKSDKYVEPEHGIVFLPNSDKDFIWQSQRTGFNHLFHYNIDKGLVRQITKGDWLVTNFLGFNAKKKEIFFTSTMESPLERNLYKVNWLSGKIHRLDKEAGTHSGLLSENGEYLLDTFNSGDVPRKINIIQTEKSTQENLLSAKNTLENFALSEVRNVTLKADDGTPLYGKLMLPKNMDTTKKYPVIVYLYNGPHAQLINNTFPKSENLWYDYLTQNGYIVFSMDGRGSSNRGLKFEQSVYKNLGETEMKDQLKGVEYLKSLPFVDAERMGVHGWSFGGFMTTSLMLKYPEIFKVGVAGGPVIDWNMYEIMYTERYMQSPQLNPEGYKQANLLDKVSNLKGKLLMIHGTDDDVVVWQQSMKFITKSIDQGVQVDYFVYPNHKHNVLGKDRVHLMQKITDYFDLYLKK